MASFTIRKIDDGVWRKVKSKAALEKRTLKDVAVDLFVEYAEAPARKPHGKKA